MKLIWFEGETSRYGGYHKQNVTYKDTEFLGQLCGVKIGRHRPSEVSFNQKELARLFEAIRNPEESKDREWAYKMLYPALRLVKDET